MSPTYELIDSITLSSAQSSILFNNIPQTYDDLMIVSSARTNRSATNDGLKARFNGESSDSSHSQRSLVGDGSSTYSFTSTFTRAGYTTAATTLANTFGSSQLYIANYNSNTYKSSSSFGCQENNTTAADMGRAANLWSNTSVITSIQILPVTGTAIVSGSTFELYGIKNADDGSEGYFGPAARGGDEVYTTGDGYKVHVFKTSGTLEVTAPGEVEYLVIAGGGAGGLGTSGAGGGGAGGYLTGFINLNIGQKMVIIGAGGVGGTDPYTFTSGNNSSMDTITSIGGGLGMVGYAGSYTGGSGGGGAAGNAGSLGVSGQGNSGGDGSEIYPTRSTRSGGGGGGAGGAGVNGGLSSPGVGGPGRYSSLSNSTLAYGGTGSLGESSNVAASGSQNTGNGGGSSAVYGSGSTGSGGSGIVIIRYKV